MAGTVKKTDLGLLEEDDEFEEFPTEGTYSTSFEGQISVEHCSTRFHVHRKKKECNTDTEHVLSQGYAGQPFKCHVIVTFVTFQVRDFILKVKYPPNFPCHWVGC